jgi:hypothetical protein
VAAAQHLLVGNRSAKLVASGKEPVKSNMRSIRIMKFRLSRIRFDASRIAAMISVKGGQPLVRVLIRALYPMGGVPTSNWARVIVRYLRYLFHLKKTGGIPQVVKYLKVASVILQQAIAGYKIPDLTPLGMRISRSKSGIPRIIPSYQRKLIRQDNFLVIRFWLSCFSIYRDLFFMGTLKLKTITGPSTASYYGFLKRYVNRFVRIFFRPTDYIFDGSGPLFQILSSGPQSMRQKGEYGTHPFTIIRSFRALDVNPELRDSLLYIASFTSSKVVEL